MCMPWPRHMCCWLDFAFCCDFRFVDGDFTHMTHEIYYKSKIVSVWPLAHTMFSSLTHSLCMFSLWLHFYEFSLDECVFQLFSFYARPTVNCIHQPKHRSVQRIIVNLNRSFYWQIFSVNMLPLEPFGQSICLLLKAICKMIVTRKKFLFHLSLLTSLECVRKKSAMRTPKIDDFSKRFW